MRRSSKKRETKVDFISLKGFSSVIGLKMAECVNAGKDSQGNQEDSDA